MVSEELQSRSTFGSSDSGFSVTTVDGLAMPWAAGPHGAPPQCHRPAEADRHSLHGHCRAAPT